ncbi:sensor histidine kinase [uncultured Dechloromonas sp.]|uniref:sensor histidine kinase n=1 Tax=uncultured Dechloromonas sp. TaxID=171719 RepID=UPI0025F7F58F|nr:sensor histidine kinase [uncultured Dechloromonas sp.]
MDLRRRLLGWLGLLLGGLLAMTLIVQLHSLRADIGAEVAASSRLVEVLLAADGAAPDLPQRLADADLRHLSMRSVDTPAVPEAPPLLARLGLVPESGAGHEIRVGAHRLIIAPNPASEIEERLGDTVRLLITLLLYSGATLLAVWWAADRALSPVRALEDGLHRLARGESDPALPSFALREFRRVAGAIERLAAALGEARAAQRALARQLIAVQEEERRALARDLHDEMGQTLTAINATAAHLERHAARLDATAVAECAADLRRDIRRSGEQLRAMLKTLRPHGLDASGLAAMLRELLDSWRNRETGIEFAVELPAHWPAVDETTALTLYRILQEALTNVVRHSGARHCTVRIVADTGCLRLSIEDDGDGLPQTGPARRGGLLGMAERLEMAGGRLQLDSLPGRGLRLSAELPAMAGTANGREGERE